MYFVVLVAIHSDFNEQNILIKQSADGEWDLAGVLDFQDSNNGLKVYDIAIYIMYMMTLHEDPIDIAGYCLQGFIRDKQLTQTELDVLYICIASRLVQSVVLGLHYYQLHKDPYLLVTQVSGWKALRALWSKPDSEIVSYWLSEKFRL